MTDDVVVKRVAEAFGLLRIAGYADPGDLAVRMVSAARRNLSEAS